MLVREWGLSGAAATLSIQSGIMFLFCHLALRSECRASKIRTGAGGFWKERRCLIDFSLPAAASGLLGSFAIWYCSAILVRERGFGEMALFSAASTFRSLVMFTPGTIGRVTAPLMNVQLGGGDQSRYGQTYRANVVLLGVSALMAALPFMLARDFFLRVFGKGFDDPSGAVTLLLLATIVEVIVGGVQQAFFAHGRLWLQFIGIVTWGTALVVLTYILAWRGAFGLALAYLGSWLIAGAFSMPAAARLNARSRVKA
jgi:O-antigen/teichoic acid export membrane protein